MHYHRSDYLRSCQPESFDIITCCWGLGYSHPLTVLQYIKKALAKGGKVAIIDNTLFSLREIMYCALLTFAECPDKLTNLMKFRFLTGPTHLGLWFRLAGLKPIHTSSGQKTYHVSSGAEAIHPGYRHFWNPLAS